MAVGWKVAEESAKWIQQPVETRWLVITQHYFAHVDVFTCRCFFPYDLCLIVNDMAYISVSCADVD